MVSSEDLLLLSTDWRNPSPGEEVHLDTEVIQERILEKSMRIRQAFAPDYVDYYARFSVLEKNETYVKVFEQHITRNAPYTDSFQIEVVWEIVTADPRSNQVAFRKQGSIHWWKKPLIWKLI